ncbi:tRNA(Ile)-lysidine synthetase [Mesorhizobium sp. Root157]|uniref:tRNA lysidine(34) synthetase TilS n=1 Tax=Mesorhizobium sp. Root157 TaxID=1736477 RepID=UPI0006FF984C|nr:tRNA lysidine(34) synthetase TilS [Mesorhizobium sp. Root157]KRA00283.1 tRNA(Ile)-lysidine synthetase [Mesorhizobium sp. Root157]
MLAALDASPYLDAHLLSHIDFSHGAVVAVSGGSDSTALLILLKDHFERARCSARLVAVTVDHALRPSSAAEAAGVKQLCERLGIAHRTMVWAEAKPETGVPAAAREARYRLLAEAARAEGIGMVLTGHTADDQAETVAMRRQRSAVDEGRGLAGMAPATLYDGAIWIVRPLIGTRREALRAMLLQRRIQWIDDPTNADTAYERPRVRAAIGANGAGFSAAIALAARAARERMGLGEQAAALIDALAAQPVRGLIRLEPEFGHGGDRAAAIYALRILLAAVGGVSFLPDEARAAALFDRLGTEPFRTTLSRVAIDARRAGIFLYREARGLPEPMPATDCRLWDGRRSITFSDTEEGLVIAPTGPADAARLAQAVQGGGPGSLVRAALCAEPALWRGGECLGLAENTAVAGLTVRPVVAPWARFLPSFDLMPARAVSDLIGAGWVPQSPMYNAGNARS